MNTTATLEQLNDLKLATLHYVNDYQFLFSRVEEQALEIDEVIRGINRELEV